MSTRTGPFLSRAVLSTIVSAAALCAAAGEFGDFTDGTGASPVVTIDQGDFAVVVNASRPGTLKRRQVADLFLKRAPRWPDGRPVEVVDLSVKDPARAAFSKDVLEQSTAGVVHYWQQQMLTGRIVPPLVKSQEALLAFVATTPGGIGYVSPGIALPEGVKAVKLVE